MFPNKKTELFDCMNTLIITLPDKRFFQKLTHSLLNINNRDCGICVTCQYKPEFVQLWISLCWRIIFDLVDSCPSLRSELCYYTSHYEIDVHNWNFHVACRTTVPAIDESSVGNGTWQWRKLVEIEKQHPGATKCQLWRKFWFYVAAWKYFHRIKIFFFSNRRGPQYYPTVSNRQSVLRSQPLH